MPVNKLNAKKNRIPDPSPTDLEITQSRAEALLRMLEKTRDVELTCEETHALLDYFAEIAARGEDTHHLMPHMHLHMELCPDCQEEFEALLRILQTPSET